MPATESTWRDTGRMHRIFAISGVVLTIGTLWMFYKDHYRSWKVYQSNINTIDVRLTKLRQQQYETGDALVEHDRAAANLAAARSQPIPAEHLQAFTEEAQQATTVLSKWREKGYPYSSVSLDGKGLINQAPELVKLSDAAAQARADATKAAVAAEKAEQDAKLDKTAKAAAMKAARDAGAAATAAEEKASALRERMVTQLRDFMASVKLREDKSLNFRKVLLGRLDAAKANVDIAIRDGLPPSEIAAKQKVVDELVGQPGDAEQSRHTRLAYNEIYESISGSRKNMDRTLKAINKDVEEAQKQSEAASADLTRLQSQEKEQAESYFTLSPQYPFIFGKKFTTLPILDAFNSRRKIENLWSEGLLQDYSHARVRRFDRCTTCHQSLTKTLPNQPTSPSYIRAEDVEMVVVPPAKSSPPQPRKDEHGNDLPLTLEDWLGIRLAPEGLLAPDDVTVALVLPKTPAARAQIAGRIPTAGRELGAEIRQRFAQVVSPPGEAGNPFPMLPGLLVGDVIAGINGQDLRTTGGDHSPRATAARLMVLAEEGEPIRLTVRRGLPNPYTSHPRLDLYLSDASPHRMQLFACTICHEGQGSATEFKWASHTPNTTNDMRRWGEEHGWFDNAHWIYPMHAQRFAESSCLKCHHDVVELEPSERFPDAPAPKVTHGYHVIRKYGCYGCHEVNGFDGPTKRVGPDLRSEPNYFAVAQQIQAELVAAQRRLTGAEGAGADNAKAAERLAAWKEQLEKPATELTAHPEDGKSRNLLRTRIEEGVAAAGAEAGGLERSLTSLAGMLKDVETPGDQRRPGPSLRFLNSKVDPIFLFDWINNPRHFRDTTRMPRFFGLWDHLKDHGGKLGDAKAPAFEPIEIRGMIEYFKTYAPDQKFEPVQHPEGISEWTNEEKLARGKVQFQTRGCLACHNHREFAESAAYRPQDEIVQGPDLSGVGSKFSPDRNPQGREWLYSWIKNPTRYHARTVMPNLFLEREMVAGPDPTNPTQGAKYFDAADDIVAYLMTSTSDWKPVEQALTADKPLDAAAQKALQELMLEHLTDAFYKDAAEDYFMNGIPPRLEGELKGAEKDLIVQPGRSLSEQQRLKYIGRKTIAKYGCFGCHDIPGFEDAKPIGTGLADWGRKDPAKLAFEHIAHYVDHGHGGGHAAAAPAHAPATGGEPAQPPPSETTEELESKEFYAHALEATNRIGFIHQKLQEPRSYDYDKTGNKRYNERLRMPQFPFNQHEREAVITFVLGLVADPPQPKYVYRPQARNAAILAGRKVLEKYNCGGCHILGLEKWKIAYAKGEMGERPPPVDYPFLLPHISPKEIEAASKPDRRNELLATLAGLLPLDKPDGKPVVFDADGVQLIDDEKYSPSELRYGFDLFQPAIVDGSVYVPGQGPAKVPRGALQLRNPTWGGALTRYLLPHVTQLEKQANPNASGSEAYGWLPPPLIGEGRKVQTGWLHDFLLEPYTIRPATFLRMPKFNMSSEEATTLANYFAAVDNAEFPYANSSARDPARLASLEADYVQRPAPPPLPAAPPAAGAPAQPTAPLPSAATAPAPPGMQRLDDAMKIVVNICVKCHLVSDYEPTGSVRAKAPNLSAVYQRLRPDFTRDWIANPKTILPYTVMPVNIKYENPDPILGQLYHGTNVEQIEALTDLLMNYDQYARQSTRIADRVVLPPTPAEGAAPPPAGSGTGSGTNP